MQETKDTNSASAVSDKNPLSLLQLNEVRLTGRLTQEPQVRGTSGGKTVAQMNIAMNRSYKDKKTGSYQDQADFITVTVWNELAKNCQKRLHKGSPVFIEGRLMSEQWLDKEGQKRFGVKVQASRVQFLSRKKAAAEPEIPFGN